MGGGGGEVGGRGVNAPDNGFLLPSDKSHHNDGIALII